MTVWEKTTIGAICKLEYGKPLPEEHRDENGLYPAFGANGEKARTNKFYFDKPSIIVGRKGSAGEINLTDAKFWPLDVTYFVTFDENRYDLKFLYFLLRCQNIPKLSKGVKPGINRNDVYSLEVIVPPLPVQKAIVAKLDAAFASIEQAIAAAERNAENAKQLVENYIDVNFQSLAATHPGGKLGDMCEGVEYGSSAKSDKTGDIPVLRMGNIIDGEIDYDDLVYTSDKAEFEKYRLRKGDVLFNRTNSPLHVGKSAVFEDERDAIFAGYLIRVKNKRELLNSNYLNYYLNSKTVRNYGYSVMSHSINQANINGSKLKEYPISVPAMQTQIDIVRKFGKLKSECVKLEYAYRNKITKFSALKQSLLQQAFNGQLVDA
jgi:type I restriction enzyme S subunit